MGASIEQLVNRRVLEWQAQCLCAHTRLPSYGPGLPHRRRYGFVERRWHHRNLCFGKVDGASAGRRAGATDG